MHKISDSLMNCEDACVNFLVVIWFTFSVFLCSEATNFLLCTSLSNAFSEEFSCYDGTGVEVKSGEPCPVEAGQGRILHLSQVLVQEKTELLVIYVIGYFCLHSIYIEV